MAQINIVMPQMGESLAEGTLVRWLKKPGQSVGRDEALFEISTDKVDTEVPAPAAGTLAAVLVEEGQTVAVGEAVAVLETEENVPASLPPTGHGSASTPPAETAVTHEPAGHFKSSSASQLVSFKQQETKGSVRKATPARSASAASTGGSREHSYSPAVLNVAGRAGVPLETLTQLPRTGRDGRLTKKDVERFLSSAGARPELVVSSARPPAADPLDSVPAEYLYRPRPEDQRVPFSPVRRRIAHHMSWSVRISPHATAFGEIDMSMTSVMLQQSRTTFEEQFEAPLTYTVLVAHAAVAALREFPALNASVVGEELIVKPHVHLGIAVALKERDELIVPVVRSAEDLSLPGLARAINGLVVRTRSSSLAPEDVRGGTFTLTNPGIFGGITGTPILNQPQVAILGLGAIVKRPVVIDDAIAIRPVMSVALTFDHRAADGMIAFRYLDRLRQLLEQPPDHLDRRA